MHFILHTFYAFYFASMPVSDFIHSMNAFERSLTNNALSVRLGRRRILVLHCTGVEGVWAMTQQVYVIGLGQRPIRNHIITSHLISPSK
jgi:hypothetical protein